ncbi:hypothetical protein [Olsenella uli]|uniref:hypothetical protein n=1 Tax=Olsenella uli TaxID=133926 RepID=UPI00241C3100|nr:hypothetical protein [Olsenella uli]
MVTLDDLAAIAARHDTSMSWALLRALLARGVSVRLPRARRHAHDHRRAYEVTTEEALWCMRHNRDVIGAVR